MLESAQFPLIMKFIRTFRDESNVYFLIEYVRGMELFDVIREIGMDEMSIICLFVVFLLTNLISNY